MGGQTIDRLNEASCKFDHLLQMGKFANTEPNTMPNILLHDNLYDHFRTRLDNAQRVRIISPFVKLGIVTELFADFNGSIQLITRASFRDFFTGVSDIEALRYLAQKGAEIKVLRALHSKLYLFDAARAIVTSANLTESGMRHNHELSVSADEQDLLDTTSAYFENLWTNLTHLIDVTQLSAWQTELDQLIIQAPDNMPNFRDAGEEIVPDIEPIDEIGDSRFHLKLWGVGDDRESYSRSVTDVVTWSNGHVSLGFPSSKKPRRFRTGDVAFHGVMVGEPNDIMIYGRSLCQNFNEERDMSSPQDIQQFPWKERWGANIRVFDSLFINSTLQYCIHVSELMANFGTRTFVDQFGNYKDQAPALALRQKDSKFLSPAAARWLEDTFAEKVHQYGSFTIP